MGLFICDKAGQGGELPAEITQFYQAHFYNAYTYLYLYPPTGYKFTKILTNSFSAEPNSYIQIGIPSNLSKYGLFNSPNKTFNITDNPQCVTFKTSANDPYFSLTITYEKV